MIRTREIPKNSYAAYPRWNWRYCGRKKRFWLNSRHLLAETFRPVRGDRISNCKKNIGKAVLLLRARGGLVQGTNGAGSVVQMDCYTPALKPGTLTEGASQANGASSLGAPYGGGPIHAETESNPKRRGRSISLPARGPPSETGAAVARAANHLQSTKRAWETAVTREDRGPAARHPSCRCRPSAPCRESGPGRL